MSGGRKPNGGIQAGSWAPIYGVSWAQANLPGSDHDQVSQTGVYSLVLWWGGVGT